MIELYFAYGSNLWTEQMVERTGPIGQSAHRPLVAHLANHRLAFNMRTEDGRAYANLMTPGKGVHGVVYSCRTEVLSNMDTFEKGYHRESVRVTLETGEEIDAMTYFADTAHQGADGRPTPEYLNKILTGAREHGLPEPYIRQIEALAARKIADHVH